MEWSRAICGEVMGLALIQPGSARYIHEDQALDGLGQELRALGISRALVVSGQRSFDAVQVRLTETLERAQITWSVEHYGGECSDANVARLRRLAAPGVQAVLGVGGGKVLDVTKLLADSLGLPGVTVPTLISNCAATNPNTTVYDADGRFERQALCATPPMLTIVDDAVLRASPLNYFVSGLGDTLAKPYEAALGSRDNSGWIGRVALSMAWQCSAYVEEEGPRAIREYGQPSNQERLRDLADIILLGAGMVGGIGGDAVRSAGAHAFHNALTRVVSHVPASHGDKVAYGLMLQEVLAGRDASALATLQRSLRALQLPLSWTALTHLPFPSTTELKALASNMNEDKGMHALPILTAEMLGAAIARVDGLVE